MDVQEALEWLKQASDAQYKKNIIRLGIPEANSFGVSSVNIKKLAKQIKCDHQLGLALWQTGIHEAKLLAVSIMEPAALQRQELEDLMQDVVSWDLCDHMCKHLCEKRADALDLIQDWVKATPVYQKRAAFSLMANMVMHDASLQDDAIQDFLQLIYQYGDDERDHVKKAVSWAMREIGKIDERRQEQVLELAHEFMESSSRTYRWIGRDVKREVENLVKVEGRRRLITRKSKMGSV